MTIYESVYTKQLSICVKHIHRQQSHDMFIEPDTKNILQNVKTLIVINNIKFVLFCNQELNLRHKKLALKSVFFCTIYH